MGGGAGITWTLHGVRGQMKWSRRKQTFRPHGPITLDSFDAEGYMDGMDDVRGDLLKVTSIVFDVNPDDLPWWKRNFDLRTDIFTICGVTRDCTEPHAVSSGGYIRSKWPASFPLDLVGTLYLENELMGVTVTVKPADPEEFGRWYTEAFETWDTGLDDEREMYHKAIRAAQAKLAAGGLTEDAEQALIEKIESDQEELDNLPSDAQWWEDQRDDMRINYGAD